MNYLSALYHHASLADHVAFPGFGRSACLAHKIFLALFCVAALLFLLSTQPAYCLTPEDILVVYNQNMPESKEVAEYYTAKRTVPADNLIGVSVPNSETMTRSRFETDLCAKIEGPVNALIDNGRQPVILLVYGIPIRLQEDAEYDTEGLHNKAETKIQELDSLVSGLTARLEELITPKTSFPPHAPPATADAISILERAKNAVTKATAIKIDPKHPRISAGAAQEISAIVFQLAGATPVAEAITRQMTDKESKTKASRGALSHWAGVINIQLAHVPFRGLTNENAFEIASLVRTSRGLIGELGFWLEVEQIDPADQTSASVDSELTMLLIPQYSKAKWLPNPFQDQFSAIPGIDWIRNQTTMVARLDGPSPATAKRLVDDALWVEKHGLEGVFYIDARGMRNKENGNYYAEYDSHLRNLYQILTEKSSMKVVLDNKPELFPEQSCKDAALYCGWYSLFKWQKGAVGFHVASSEAKTLKKPDSEVWCKRMLEKGVAATLGPVAEPYLQSFPLPDVFFPLLMTGKAPLIEVYYRSTPFLSWRQILIGDPMYTPFRQKPALKE